MMNYKFIGIILIFTSFTYGGFYLALRCCQRTQQLNQIIQCLSALKTHIGYSALPLEQALLACCYGVDGYGSEIFKKMGNILRENNQISPCEAIQIAMKSVGTSLALKDPERELLLYFSANLGSSGRKEQERYLEVIKNQFEKYEQEAIQIRNLNAKMYRYLGICSGITMIILLY